MAIEEIRSTFLGYYEKRLKLQLLRSELVSLRESATGACVTDEGQLETHYSLETFDTQVIESVIADTYSITCEYPDLLALLTRIRQVARVANNKIRIFFGIVQLPLTTKAKVIRDHNEFMRPNCETIAELCSNAVETLEALLART